MPPSSVPGLRWRRLWQALGALLVAVIVYASLAPRVPGPDLPGFDKFGHLLAYALLMGWYAQLYPRPPQRRRVALACIALGVALEILQPLLGPRRFEWLDMLADAVGVGLAYAACLGPPGRLLVTVERRLLAGQ